MILRRIEGQRFSEVLPAWKGRAVAILAGGPSLTREQFHLVREAREVDRVRVIAINDSYLLAPWADVHYAADAKWHRWHTQGVDKPLLGLNAEDVRVRWKSFRGQKCTIEPTQTKLDDDAVHVLRNKDFPCDYGQGISLDPRRLATGRHSGFQALNLAILAGAARILLLGYDGRVSPDGAVHWHGDHPVKSPIADYPEFRRAFTQAERDITAAGVIVVNCSPCSAIETFPKVPLAEALEEVLA